MTKTLLERFEEKVMVDPNSGCWLWTACVQSGGYGLFGGGPKRETYSGNKLVLAHRFSYQHHVGQIPDGLELDHKCRTRACVNPAHLEAVTKSENVRRGLSPAIIRAAAPQRHRTHCPKGHAYEGDNVYLHTSKLTGIVRRHCKACWKLRSKAA